MKTTLIQEICTRMDAHLTEEQMQTLQSSLRQVFQQFHIPDSSPGLSGQAQEINTRLLNLFLSAKRIEGCSEHTLKYYSTTLLAMVNSLQKNVCEIGTDDLRFYLSRYQALRNTGKTTLDNIRRILSSFFAWLEDENYISKSPVRRIRKIKTTQVIREVLTDENLESLRDQCRHPRDLAIIDLLISTGIRVGELVGLNREDIDFINRECIVLGKGDKERRVYFDAKTKVHLLQYLTVRSDSNIALFVGLRAPWNRLSISGVERLLARLGQDSHVPHVHPHKFRRTMATMAIEKGMPIEQLQKLLGHTQIDTTLHYAIVNENNVKLSHQKYIC